MIDISLLASGAVAALVPYLVKGSETIAGEAGKSLWKWITEKLTAGNKQKDLVALKENPNDQRIQGKLEAALEDLLRNDESLIAELEKLVRDAKTSVVSVSNSKNVVTGNINAGGQVIIGDHNTTTNEH